MFLKKLKPAAFLAAGLLLSTALSAQTTLPANHISVVDQRGIEVKLPRPAQRIVTIPVPMASIVMALDGSSRRVVGMHPSAKLSIEDGLLKKIFPEAVAIASDITRGGMFTPNIETVLSLKPDLVVTWSEPLEAVQAMERAGLTVLTLKNDPSNLSQHFGNLDKLSKALGLESRAGLIRADIERKNTLVQQALATVRVRPKTLYLQQAKAAFRASGNSTFQDFWMTQSGGSNVAASLTGHQQQTTIEQLIAWNPDVIFLGTFDGAMPADIYANPALASIAAVRNKRVYKVPHGGYRWDPGNHESALILLWSAAVLHPERLNPDLRREMRSTYESIYKYKLADAEIDGILHMQANSVAPGYAAKFGP
jgi:iron complex transport system substrate-binding protein